MKSKLSLLATLLLCITGAMAQQLAFPGAEGFAAYATGGRGGKVVHVTNLNASGSGSLADAVSQPNRIVVFDVSGVIDITNKSITIASNITIAGQTAPGEGITIYGGRVIASKSKNVIIRYIRMRGGKAINQKKCTLTLDECDNLILDHCSISWGPWDNVHIANANNITWQYCINAEGIEPQRFGSITDGTRNWTVHHCLWANNKSRNPKMKCYLQYYNNVVYNYGMGIVGGHSSADNYQDVMNNYFIAGPEGSYKYFDQWTETDHLYSTGNYYDGNCDGVLNGTLITDHNGATVMQKPSLSCNGPMNLETAEQAYQHIVNHVGASRVRDVHDKRILEQLTSLGKKGAFIANEDGVGGIGTVANGTAPTDTDRDGMPDSWELEQGLNPQKDDANGLNAGNGYTNIENYINSLATQTTYLAQPTFVTARLTDATTAELSWKNGDDNEETEGIIVEQSEDRKTFREIQRLSKDATTTTIGGLTPRKVYYFRLKVFGQEAESQYSSVVTVNEEYLDLDKALAEALALADNAEADVTLGYPSQKLQALKEAITSARAFIASLSEQTTKEQVEQTTAALAKAVSDCASARIMTFTNIDKNAYYVIYSYGTAPNANATDADKSIKRRYLSSIKTKNGLRDSLVYRIGLSDASINAGQPDAVAQQSASVWTIADAGSGYVYIKNADCHKYLQVSSFLTDMPLSVRPYYAKTDNDKLAFFIDVSSTSNKCLNVGTADANGTGGPLDFFNGHADRTRLRWVIVPTAFDPTAGIAPMQQTIGAPRFYNLHGAALHARPAHGIYIESIAGPDGTPTYRKCFSK
ncbi:MAG: hypothetical protein K6D91_00065 [Prevotella sp.]|nr:hypothetical protein [Prevotella sp.]